MKFTQIPADTFEKLQLNAGVLLTEFSPETATVDREKILGATSGGINFTDTPEFQDFGEDIDNCPKNTKELKKIVSREVKVSGTFLTLDAPLSKRLMAAADVTGNKIKPRDILKDEDFSDLWWVGDYSDENGNDKGGFVAIKICNALSTGGFSIQSGDKAKGTASFEFTAHYSVANPDEVPYEVYIKSGEADS